MHITHTCRLNSSGSDKHIRFKTGSVYPQQNLGISFFFCPQGLTILCPELLRKSRSPWQKSATFFPCRRVSTACDLNIKRLGFLRQETYCKSRHSFLLAWTNKKNYLQQHSNMSHLFTPPKNRKTSTSWFIPYLNVSPCLSLSLSLSDSEMVPFVDPCLHLHMADHMQINICSPEQRRFDWRGLSVRERVTMCVYVCVCERVVVHVTNAEWMCLESKLNWWEKTKAIWRDWNKNRTIGVICLVMAGHVEIQSEMQKWGKPCANRVHAYSLS